MDNLTLTVPNCYFAVLSNDESRRQPAAAVVVVGVGRRPTVVDRANVARVVVVTRYGMVQPLNPCAMILVIDVAQPLLLNLLLRRQVLLVMVIRIILRMFKQLQNVGYLLNVRWDLLALAAMLVLIRSGLLEEVRRPIVTIQATLLELNTR